MKHFIITILIVFLSITYTKGQNYNIDTYDNQTITTCSGNIYDSGGPSGNYNAGESFITTISPTGNFTNITFNYFNVAIGDMLEVFDGADVNATLIAIYNNGNSPTGQTIRATFLGSQGKLTLRWTSVDTAAGWSASISCGIPCQSFNTIITQSTPPFTIDSGIYYIDICLGDTVSLRASANFYMNDFFYHQDTTTTDFVWDLSGNNVVLGQNVVTTLSTVQGYNAMILATDTLGCPASQGTEVRIRVSTIPDFTGTDISPSPICQYDSTLLMGSVTPTPWSITPSLSVAGTTYLPDGSGVSYTSDLVFSGFDVGQILENTNDLAQIYMEIEHSYIGDLNIVIKCPNNSAVTLKSYPGGGQNFLGEPTDNNAMQSPGLGYMYQWSAGGTTTMASVFNTYNYSFTDVLGATYTNHPFLPPSTAYPATSTATGTLPIIQYKPETPITNLLGCPLNGTWKLVITDNLAIDNGFIFSWGIDFDSTILPVSWGYIPVVDSTYWNYGVGDTLYNQINTTGQQVLTYSMIDQAGCLYDTTLFININPSPIIELGNDTNICINDSISLYSNVNIPNTSLLWSTGETSDSINLVPSNTASYSLISTSSYGCVGYDTIEIALAPLPIINTSSDSLICIGTKASLYATGGTIYQWSNGANTDTTSAWPSTNHIYHVTVTDNNACVDQAQIKITVAPLPTIEISNDTVVCEGTDAFLTVSGGDTYVWNNGPTTASQTVTPNTSTTYTAIVTDANKCRDSANVNVDILEYPVASIISNYDTICRDGLLSLVASGGMSYIWHNGEQSNLFSELANSSKLYSVLAINTQDGTSCHDSTSVYIVVENCAVYVPSAFTPNGDGLNDVFYAKGIISNTAPFKLLIYNRMGQLLFETSDFNAAWDGTFDGNKVPQGVYTWMISVGEESIGSYQLTGTVTLIR